MIHDLQPWVRPVEPDDEYEAGDRVLHHGYMYESEVNSNIWEPGAEGSDGLWVEVE